MNAQIAKEWVAELRSGKWKQGKAALAKMTGEEEVTHCCLGVLCEIAASRQIVSRQPASFGEIKFNDETALLPREVMEWAEMKSMDGRYPSVAKTEFLTTNNDSGASFGEIARIIEHHAADL